MADLVKSLSPRPSPRIGRFIPPSFSYLICRPWHNLDVISRSYILLRWCLLLNGCPGCTAVSRGRASLRTLLAERYWVRGPYLTVVLPARAYFVTVLQYYSVMESSKIRLYHRDLFLRLSLSFYFLIYLSIWVYSLVRTKPVLNTF